MHGEPAIINGTRTDRNRTEAEFRAERMTQRAGERFEQFEVRMFEQARQRFDLAISAARAAMDEAGLDVRELDAHASDLIGDTWNADYRAEKE